MKFYSTELCPKCGNKLLIVGNLIICKYCETEEHIDDNLKEQINQTKLEGIQ